MAKDTRREAVSITLPGDRKHLVRLVTYDAQGKRVATKARWRSPILSQVLLMGETLFIAELGR